MSDGRCDVCGRFAGSKGKSTLNGWQIDRPGSTPQYTFRCPRCQKIKEKNDRRPIPF